MRRWTQRRRPPVSIVHEFSQPAHYQIRVSGAVLQEQLGDYGALAVIPQSGNETLLVGSVADQWALHGLLARISSLGLGLLLLQRVETAAGTSIIPTGSAVFTDGSARC
jgi:hypothetical protein